MDEVCRVKKINFSYWLLYAIFFLNLPLDHVGQSYPKELRISLEPTPYEVGVETFKTPRQIKDFLKNGRVGNKFVEDHKNHLISASHIFEMPYAFQTCLLYNESRFKTDAISHAGARGVAQFTKETYDFLTKILQLGRKNLDELPKNRMDFEYEDDLKSKYVLFNRVLFSELFIKWQAYVRNNNIEFIPLRRKHYKRLVYDPQYAIGLSSLYLKYLKERMRYRLQEQYNHTEGSLDPNIYLTLAGAYNQGIERTWKLSAKNKNIALQHIVTHQSRIGETRRYIRLINSCMSPDES